MRVIEVIWYLCCYIITVPRICPLASGVQHVPIVGQYVVLTDNGLTSLDIMIVAGYFKCILSL